MTVYDAGAIPEKVTAGATAIRGCIGGRVHVRGYPGTMNMKDRVPGSMEYLRFAYNEILRKALQLLTALL